MFSTEAEGRFIAIKKKKNLLQTWNLKENELKQNEPNKNQPKPLEFKPYLYFF